MGRLAAVLLLALGAAVLSVAACQQAGSPTASPPNGYSLTSEQTNKLLTACRAQPSVLPWPVTNVACSCMIREFPRSVPQEDVEAVWRETDSTERLQLVLKSRPIRHVVAHCMSEALEGPASMPEGSSPPAPLPNGGYTLTIAEQNSFLTACKAPSKVPSDIKNALCGCVLRETPRWIPREDIEAIGRETDETKYRQMIIKNRAMRHVFAMCLSEGLDGPAAPN